MGCLSKLPLISAAGGAFGVLLSLPACLSGTQSLLQQSGDHPLLLMTMRALLNCSFGALFGSSLLLFAYSATLRKHLPRKLLIAVQSEQLPIYFCVSSLFSSCLLFTTCELAADHKGLQAAAAMTLFANLANSCWLVPHQVRMLREREALADQLGAEPSFSFNDVLSLAVTTAAGDNDSNWVGVEYRKLTSSFKKVHSLGMGCSVVSFGCLVSFLFA